MHWSVHKGVVQLHAVQVVDAPRVDEGAVSAFVLRILDGDPVRDAQGDTVGGEVFEHILYDRRSFVQWSCSRPLVKQECAAERHWRVEGGCVASRSASSVWRHGGGRGEYVRL